MVPRRARLVWAMALALASAISAAGSLGCGALLDLDVEYPDGGDASATGPDANPAPALSDDGGAPGRPDEAGAPGDVDAASPDDASGTHDGTLAFDGGSPDAGGSATDAQSPGADAAGPGDASPDAPPSAPPYLLQSAYGSSDGTTLTVPVALSRPVIAGDTLIVAVEYSSDMPMLLTDSLHSAFQRAGTGVPTGDDNGLRSEVWYAIGVAGGSETVTATFSGITTASFIGSYVHEYADISALDGASANSGYAASASTMASGDVFTSVDNDLLFGFAVTTVATASNGFTTERSDGSDLTEDRVVAVPSTVQATATTAGGSWAMIGAAFKPR